MAEDRIERFKALNSKLKTTSDIGAAEGFAKSFAWSIPGLLGVEPPEDVRRWESEHPVAAFGAGALGLGGPYLGWYKAAEKIPRLKDAISAADKIAKTESPFLGAVRREAITLFPFETLRVAGSIIGGEDLAKSLGTTFAGADQVALQSGFDLGTIAVASGGLSKLASFGRRRAKTELPSGADIRAAHQVQLRQVLEAQAQGAPSNPGAINALQRQIRIAQPEGRVVNSLEDGGDIKGLNRLFNPKDSPGVSRKRFMRGTGPEFFSSDEAWQEAAKASGLADNWQFAQYPRFVESKTKSGRKNIKAAITKTLAPIDSNNGWYFGRDKTDSLFVMARKLDEDRWVLFKTDTPGAFVPKNETWAKMQKQRAAMFEPLEKTIKPIGDAVWDTTAKVAELPLIETRGLDSRSTKIGQIVDRVAAASGLKESEALNRMRMFTKNYLAPAMRQFVGEDPRAGRALAIAQASKTAAEAEAERIFHGGRVLSENARNLFQAIVSGASPKGQSESLKKALDALRTDANQTDLFKKIWLGNMTREEAIAVGAEEKALKVWDLVHKIQGELVETQGRMKVSMGADVAALGPHHLGISQSWVGDYRVPIVEGNKTIGYASGLTEEFAQAEADKIIGIAAEQGRQVSTRKAFALKNFEGEIELLSRLSAADVQNFAALRREVYKDVSSPTLVTRRPQGYANAQSFDDIEKAIFRQIKNYKIYEAKTATRAATETDISKIGARDQALAAAVRQRIGYVFGEQGKISEGINKAVDTIFEPALGKNSASKIVGTGNKLLFRLTLGFANVGFNMANMLTFVQTALPQMAFLASAAPSRISQFYTHYPVAGLKSMNDIGVFDILKATGRSFKAMGKPSAQLMKHFERGAAEGVWDPRFIEEFVGEQSRKAINMRGVLSGQEPFSKLLEVMADFIPATSEKFARGHAFAMGHTFWKDVAGVTDDELLYQLSKQFVEKTQYLYSTGDRAAIITGPLGSAFGLFKNWPMHFLMWMMEYAGEGVAHGNWKPLLTMVGGTSAIGGVAALPLFATADATAKWLTDESIMQHTYSQFGAADRDSASMSDAVFYGFPALLGFSIQNQVSAPFMDPGADAARLMSFAWWDRMQYAGKAFGSVVDQMTATGQHPISDRQTLNLFARAFAPKNIYRTAQVIQDEALRSLSSGYPVVGELSPAERWMYGFGLNPRWVEARYRVADELWKDQEARRAAVSNYGQAFFEAKAGGDYNEMKTIVMRAMFEGVDISSVIRSARARESKNNEDVVERQFSPEAILGYKKLGLVE